MAYKCNEKLPNGETCWREFYNAQGLGMHKALAHKKRKRAPEGPPFPLQDGDASVAFGGGGQEYFYDEAFGGFGDDEAGQSAANGLPFPRVDRAMPGALGGDAGWPGVGLNGSGGGADANEDGDSDAERPLPERVVVPPSFVDVRAILCAQRRVDAFTPFQKGLAHWLLTAGVSERDADQLLALVRSASPGDLATLPRQARTLYARLDACGSVTLDRAPLSTVEIRLIDGATVPMCYFDTWAVVKWAFLRNDRFKDDLTFTFIRKVKPGTPPVRVYDEMWTGSWWEAAVERHPGHHIIPVIIHVDDTPVGGRSVTPVYVTVGNLPKRLRSKKSGMEPVAYIPPLEASEAERNREEFRLRRRAFLHACIKEIVRPLAAVHLLGGEVMETGGLVRRVLPLLAVVVADNEEKGRLSLCYHKHNSAMPCHQCEVPLESMGNTVLTSTTPFSLRTVEDSKRKRETYLQRQAAGAGKGALEALCVVPSMHLDVDNGFWAMPDFDIHQGLPPDRLHDADLGVTQWLVTNLLAKLSKVAKLELDKRLRAMTSPPIAGVKSFGAPGLTGLQRLEGAHYRALTQLLPIALVNLSETPDWRELAVLLADWNSLYGVTRQSAITATELDQWQKEAASWAAEFKRLLGRYMPSGGAFPKLHAFLGGHLRDAVLAYGVPDNYDASDFEHAHVANVKVHAHNVSRAAELSSQIAARAERVNIADNMVDSAGAQPGRRRVSDGKDNEDAEVSGAHRRVLWSDLMRQLEVPPNQQDGLFDIIGGLDSSAAAAAVGLRNFDCFTAVRTASGAWAYAHPAYRGRSGGRYDSVEVAAPGRPSSPGESEAPIAVVLLRSIIRLSGRRNQTFALVRQLAPLPLRPGALPDSVNVRAWCPLPGDWAAVPAAHLARRITVTRQWWMPGVPPSALLVNLFVYDHSTAGTDSDDDGE